MAKNRKAPKGKKASTKKPAKKGSGTSKSKPAKAAAATAAFTPSPINNNNKRTSQAPSAQASKKLKGLSNSGSSQSSSPLPSLLASLDSSTSSYLPSVRTPLQTMNDVVGLDALKQEVIDSIVDPFALDEARAKFLNIEQPKGVLLVGPPGCGKTIIADAIVNSIKAKGKDVNYYQETGSCLSQWLGESERNIRSLFAFAHANSPAVIFMDELDGLGFKRENSHSGNTSTRITTLLTEINNVTRGQVLLIAATNCQSQVDQALIRPGRFDLSVKVPLPNAEGRSQILKHYIGKKQLQIEAADIQRITQETVNWSGAKLETLVNRLHISRLKKACPDYANTSLTRLKTVMKTVLKVDLGRDILPLLESMREK